MTFRTYQRVSLPSDVYFSTSAVLHGLTLCNYRDMLYRLQVYVHLNCPYSRREVQESLRPVQTCFRNDIECEAIRNANTFQQVELAFHKPANGKQQAEAT